MDSGIYQLTFNNGDTYVGKSLHLRTRWRQHADKIEKGTAARNMQEAYKLSGYNMPNAKVLLECHPDVLDEYEGYFINWLKPSLNTQIPQVRSEAEQWALIRHMEAGNAVYSMPTMLIALENFSGNVSTLESKVEDLIKNSDKLVKDYKKLETTWDNRAIRDNRANQQFVKIESERDSLTQMTKTLETKVHRLEAWRLRVNRATWWQRLWMTW